MKLRNAFTTACALGALAFFAAPAAATVTAFTVSGTFADGKVLGGSFTYDDSLLDGSTGANPYGYSKVSLTIDGVALADQNYNSTIPAYFGGRDGTAAGMNVSFRFVDPRPDLEEGYFSFLLDTASASDFAQGILSSNKLTGRYDTAGDGPSSTLNSGATVTARSANTPSATPAVPEPATWAMMIAGFGLTGAAMRRRRPSVPMPLA